MVNMAVSSTVAVGSSPAPASMELPFGSYVSFRGVHIFRPHTASGGHFEWVARPLCGQRGIK